MAFITGKLVFGILLLFTASVYPSVSEEAKTTGFSSLLSSIRRRARLSTTETSAEQTTTEPTTPAPLSLDEKKNDIDKKIDEYFTKTNCGVLKVNSTVPWIVVIEHTDPEGKDKRKTVSKGVLIDDQHVLTTVSSIHNSYPFWIVSSVRLGDPVTWITETSQRSNSSYTRIDIDQVYQHASKDLAIIKLVRKVEFTDYIQPICVPLDDNYNFRELSFHMCKREPQRKLDVKLVSAMPLAPQDCETLFHRKGAEFGTAQFCAWDEFGDTCTGEVGGPLMVRFNGRFIVIGLSSYVLTPDDFDADEYPGVYVKVGGFLKWINSILVL